MMDSLQILKIISRFQAHTIGVYPADQIPWVWTKLTAFVINIDDHTRSGMHWVAIYVDKFGNGFYFDSFGLPPLIRAYINRLRKNCKSFRWNVCQLQSDSSDVCDQYCIMFLYFMSKKIGFKKFLAKFSTNLAKNDDILRRFVHCKNTAGQNFVGSGGCIVRCLQNCVAKLSLL